MISIFTPTYNRAYILTRLYNSLKNQTNKNFEWIVIDDGSTDNTEELVKGWIKRNEIIIHYFKQQNQGKPIAHNKGVYEAKGELVVCVDSDDYLTENAVEVIEKKWNNIDKRDCIGMVGMRIFENGQPVGTKMPSNLQFAKLQELYSKYKYKGDTILIYKSDIIKKYKFPKIEGEKFIPETYLYDQLDQEGKLAIIQEGIYICEYLPDGYTANSAKLIKNNPKGYTLMAKQRLELAVGFKEKIKAAAKVTLGSWLANERQYLKNSSHKILILLSVPFALYIYIARYKNI